MNLDHLGFKTIMMALHFTEQTITHIIQKDSEYLNVDSKFTVQRKTVDSSDRCGYHSLPSIRTKVSLSSKIYTAFPHTLGGMIPTHFWEE